ncbi:MAG: hypothetical protein C4K60_10965 [Ideonella sp. MAG2]|nr:MAG: hypothetical protein C4K60_10965 [Ideonella sp. MAG2]
MDVSKLSPQQQAHWAKARANQPASTPLYNYDITAPTVSAVKVGATVNAGLKYAEALISLTVRENLAGLSTVYVTLEGPDGQQASSSWSSSYPEKGRQTLNLAVSMSDVTQNGTWRVKSVQVADANYNSTYYNEAQLAALGTTTFEVVKAQGDSAAASLQSGGTNLTPVVSRSTPPAGMLPGSNARVGLRIPVTDAGTSGVRSVSVTLCPVGQYWNCIYLGGNVSMRGQTSVSVTVGGTLNSYNQLGTYVVDSVSTYDYAGNYRYYYSGDPVLSTLLDVSTVEVTE